MTRTSHSALPQLYIALFTSSTAAFPVAVNHSRAITEVKPINADNLKHLNEPGWKLHTMLIIFIVYFISIWVGTAIWEARKYDKEERFRTRFIRGLCCGQRRNVWHKRCRVCRKYHYCEACADAKCDLKQSNPYIELRTMWSDARGRSGLLV
jgi:hypothetical protein